MILTLNIILICYFSIILLAFVLSSDSMTLGQFFTVIIPIIVGMVNILGGKYGW